MAPDEQIGVPGQTGPGEEGQIDDTITSTPPPAGGNALVMLSSRRRREGEN